MMGWICLYEKCFYLAFREWGNAGLGSCTTDACLGGIRFIYPFFDIMGCCCAQCVAAAEQRMHGGDGNCEIR